MNCYNHNETSAVGICKNCNKGLCKFCVTDCGDGLACTASCVEEVEQVNKLIRKNKKAYNAMGKQHRNVGIVFILFAILAIIIPYFITNKLQFATLPLASIFLLLGILRIVAGNKLDRDEKPI